MHEVPWQQLMPLILPIDYARTGIPGLRWNSLYEKLAQVVAIPGANGPTFVTDEILAGWRQDVTFESLLDAARRNLEQSRTPATFQMFQPPGAQLPLLHATLPAGYQAAWFSVPDTLVELAGGTPVVWAPSAQILVVVPESSVDHVRASFDAMETHMKQHPPSLTGAPWTVVDGGLAPWLPAPDHPLHQRALEKWNAVGGIATASRRPFEEIFREVVRDHYPESRLEPTGPTSYLLHHSDSQYHDLDVAFIEYDTRDKSEDEVRERVRALLQPDHAGGQDDVPWDLLRPLVRSVQMLYNEMVFDQVPYRVIAPGLIEMLGIDRPDTIEVVNDTHFKRWPAGVTADQLFAKARENFYPHVSSQGFATGRPEGSESDLLFAREPVGYEVSLLLVPALFEAMLTVKIGDHTYAPRPVIFAPSRSDLIIVAESIEAHLTDAMDFSEQVHKEHTRPLNAAPWTVQDGQLVPWLPEPNHPLATRAKVRHALEASWNYGTQKQFFDETDVGQSWRDDREIWFMPLQTYNNGRTVTSLFEGLLADMPGLVALLPEADLVSLVRQQPGGEPGEAILVPLADMVKICELEPWTEMAPRRWSVPRFPDAQQWAALQGCQIKPAG